MLVCMTKQNDNTMTHWSGADPASTWCQAAADVCVAIEPDASRHDRSGDFVHEGMAAARERGLLTMLVPSDLGGGGATYAEAAAALATMARGCPATALTLSMHMHQVAAQVWRHRHDLPAPLLARVVEEGVRLVSTGAGDWIDSNGSAVPVDGGFRVSGRKSPSSGAPGGDVLITSARWETPEGVRAIHFAVPFSAPGVTIEETWDTMGMRATGSHTVVLQDVFVPEGAVSLTRVAGEWHPLWNIVMGTAMPLIVATYVGVAEEAVERAVQFAEKRRDSEAVQITVGRLLNHLRAAQDSAGAMVRLADDLHFDNSDELASAMLSRKTMTADHLLTTARLAMEAAGGAGYAVGSGIERLFRDVHGVMYHPLPSARQELFTGRLALGLEPVSGRA